MLPPANHRQSLPSSKQPSTLLRGDYRPTACNRLPTTRLRRACAAIAEDPSVPASMAAACPACQLLIPLQPVADIRCATWKELLAPPATASRHVHTCSPHTPALCLHAALPRWPLLPSPPQPPCSPTHAWHIASVPPPCPVPPRSGAEDLRVCSHRARLSVEGVAPGSLSAYSVLQKAGVWCFDIDFVLVGAGLRGAGWSWQGAWWPCLVLLHGTTAWHSVACCAWRCCWVIVTLHWVCTAGSLWLQFTFLAVCPVLSSP